MLLPVRCQDPRGDKNRIIRHCGAVIGTALVDKQQRLSVFSHHFNCPFPP